jgi:hypothetical protein
MLKPECSPRRAPSQVAPCSFGCHACRVARYAPTPARLLAPLDVRHAADDGGHPGALYWPELALSDARAPTGPGWRP